MSSSDSDCVITEYKEGEKVFRIIDDEPGVKKFKTEQNFNLMRVAGDGHCIANCFSIYFDEPLDMVLDNLDKEFRQNISIYEEFSDKSKDGILKEVYAYITEKIYDNSTADMFLNAFSNIYKTKVIVSYSNQNSETVIGEIFERAIHVHKSSDHFDLVVPICSTHKSTSLEDGEPVIDVIDNEER